MGLEGDLPHRLVLRGASLSGPDTLTLNYPKYVFISKIGVSDVIGELYFAAPPKD
jgi:hypothetical protein